MVHLFVIFLIVIFKNPRYYVYKDSRQNSYSIYDFALIKLDRPTSIQPVCMPYNLENPYGFPYENTVLSVYSWGKLGTSLDCKTDNWIYSFILVKHKAEAADYPEYIAGTKFRVTSDYECQYEYSNEHFDPRHLLCAKNTKIKTCIYRVSVFSLGRFHRISWKFIDSGRCRCRSVSQRQRYYCACRYSYKQS